MLINNKTMDIMDACFKKADPKKSDNKKISNDKSNFVTINAWGNNG